MLLGEGGKEEGGRGEEKGEEGRAGRGKGDDLMGVKKPSVGARSTLA